MIAPPSAPVPARDEQEERVVGENGQSERRLEAFTIPLRAGEAAVLTVRWPMDDADWEQLMALLGVMRRALVRRSDPGRPEGAA